MPPKPRTELMQLMRQHKLTAREVGVIIDRSFDAVKRYRTKPTAKKHVAITADLVQKLKDGLPAFLTKRSQPGR